MQEEANRIELPAEKNQKPPKEGKRTKADVGRVIADLEQQEGGGVVKATMVRKGQVVKIITGEDGQI